MVSKEALGYRQMSHSLAGTRSSRNIPKCSAAKFELHVCTNKTCKKQGSTEVSFSRLMLVSYGVFTQKMFVNFVDVS